MKNKGKREKRRMRNEIVDGIFKTKQNKTKQNKTKHENLGGETVRVFNTIIHCISYSNVFWIRKSRVSKKNPFGNLHELFFTFRTSNKFSVTIATFDTYTV